MNTAASGTVASSPSERSALTPSPPVRRGRGLGTALVPYIFLAPFAVLFLAFTVAPLVYASYTSVFRDTLVGGTQFAGFANYLRAFSDLKFWGGIAHLAIFGVVQVPIMLGFALAFAVVLDRGNVHARSLFRLGFFIPYAVPSVIAALIWGYLYGPVFGPFTQAANWAGLPPPNFLSDDAMLFSLANVVTWEFTGYNMIIYYAALKAIPQELQEAAIVDGASAWQYARLVQLPLLWPAILLTIIFSINGSLQLFNEPFLMRAIAPQVIGTSYTPNIYAYFLAAANQQYNYAAAISFVLGMVIASVAYLFTVMTNRRGGTAT